MAAKYCTECGHKKSILDKFCGQCGHQEGAAKIPSVSNQQQDRHIQNVAAPRIRLRSEMTADKRSDDDDYDQADEIDSVPVVSKLDVTVGGGTLDEGGNGYGCRKFTLHDLVK